MGQYKNLGIPITLDIERNLIFNLNILEKCVDKFGDMNSVLNAFTDIKSVKWLGAEMLNEDNEIWNEEHPNEQRPMLSEKQVARLLDGIGGIQEFQKYVKKAMLKGLPKEQVAEIEEEEKKTIAVQREQIMQSQMNRQQRRSQK